MALDYFQYQVSRVWYRLYWAVMVLASLALVAAYLASQYVPSLAHTLQPLHLDGDLAVAAGASLLYLVSVYWFIARFGQPFALLIGSMLFAITLLNGLTITDPSTDAYIYVGLWGLSVFMNGMYGIPMLLSSVFVSWVYVSLQSHYDIEKLSQPSMVLAGVAVVLAAAGYFFWKTKFVSADAQKLNQLSGMLRTNQQQSEIMIQSIADGIIMINTEGKITLINPAASAMTEWPEGEATGVDAQLVVKIQHEDGSDVPDDENPFFQILKDQQRISQALQLSGRQGKKMIISLVVSPVIIPGENTFIGAVAVMRDISEERAAEKQRAEFISTASHEMRTPVAAIEGYLALALNEKVSTIDSRARSYLDKAHASTQHLGKLFQDLLTSSKAEDGRLTSHPSVVEMGAFMQQLTDDLKFAAEKKGLLAEFVIGGADDTIDATTKDATAQRLIKPLYYVNVDPDRMREVVTNLFDNACKYTDSGKISIGLTGNTEVVQIYIRDTGAGIPAEDIPHLFQKFYRVDNSATRTIGGTGLGLFICRKIVELYHGRIWVESAVGKGSTFFINLPRLTSQRAAEMQAAEASKTAAASPAAAAPATPAAVNPSTPTNS